VITYSLYLEIKPDIGPIHMEEEGMTIQLAKNEYICPLGIVRNVEVLVGMIKYPANFRALGCSQDAFYPIIFGKSFLHTIGAKIRLPKEKVFIKCVGERLEFNFAKFTNKHLKMEKMLKTKWRPLLMWLLLHQTRWRDMCLIKMNPSLMRKKKL
jgi:hypothetical protein